MIQIHSGETSRPQDFVARLVAARPCALKLASLTCKRSTCSKSSALSVWIQTLILWFFVWKCPFCAYFWILLNLQGIGTDEQVLVEILSSRSTKVSFGPCQLKQKFVRKLNCTCIVTVHFRERTKQNSWILGKKDVLKRLFWMTFIETSLCLSVQLQESEILLKFCSLAFIWIEWTRSRNSWVLHDILDLKTGMLGLLEKILQTWAMWTLRSLWLQGSLKNKQSAISTIIWKQLFNDPSNNHLW